MRKKLLFSLLISSIFIANIKADSKCSYEEQARLNTSVASIKAVYEEATGTEKIPGSYCQLTDDEECIDEYDYFKISILNLTPDFYIKVKNGFDNSSRTYTYADSKDGIITFDYLGVMNITTFTFDVFSSSNTNCPDENYRVFYLTTPRKNMYYYYEDCQAHPDYDLCQKYVTFEDIPYDEFDIEMSKEEEKTKKEVKEKETKSFIVKIKMFLEKNITWISIGLGVVVIIAITLIIINKRRRRL